MNPLKLLAGAILSCALVASCSGQSGAEIPKLVRTQGMPGGNLIAELQDRAGNLWFSTGGEGVFRFDGASFTNFTAGDGLGSNHIGAIIETRDGRILVGTDSGVVRFDGRAFATLPALDSVCRFGLTCLFEDSRSHLWIATKRGGVFRYDGARVEQFLTGVVQPASARPKNELVLDIIEDRSGVLWFSSWSRGGVWRYDGSAFTNLLPPASYYASAPALAPTPGVGPSTSIPDDMIFSMEEDADGNLWLATRDHGIARYDGATFTTVWKGEGFTSRGAYDILAARNGDLWIATDRDGVWRYDGRSFRNYTTADGLVNNSVFSILEDRDGNLWFGTRGFGMSRFDGTRFVTLSE